MDIGDKLNEELLKDKKKKFLEYVNRATADLGYPAPKIRFWKIACPADSGNELAHIHLDKSPPIICVSLRRLKRMTMDQVEDAAMHEAAHIGNPEHDSVLYLTIDRVKLDHWRPPSGAQVIDGTAWPEPPKPHKPYKPSMTECNYHLCKSKKNLQPCALCGELYCPEHVKPKQPAMTGSDLRTTEDYMRDAAYHVEGGHPCLKYSDEIDDAAGKAIAKAKRKMRQMNKKEKAKQEGIPSHRVEEAPEVEAQRRVKEKLEEYISAEEKREQIDKMRRIEEFKKWQEEQENPPKALEWCNSCAESLYTEKEIYRCQRCGKIFCHRHYRPNSHFCKKPSTWQKIKKKFGK